MILQDDEVNSVSADVPVPVAWSQPTRLISAERGGVLPTGAPPSVLPGRHLDGHGHRRPDLFSLCPRDLHRRRRGCLGAPGPIAILRPMGGSLLSAIHDASIPPDFVSINPFPAPGIPSVRPSGSSILAGGVRGRPRDRTDPPGGLPGPPEQKSGGPLRNPQWPTSCRSGLPPRRTMSSVCPMKAPRWLCAPHG